jgi:hypothetical protein
MTMADEEALVLTGGLADFVTPTSPFVASLSGPT